MPDSALWMSVTRRNRNDLRRSMALRCLFAGWLILSLGACVPAQVPPQLAHTPGPGVIVAENSIETAAFTGWVPAGWKIVTSAASDQQSVILIAPDEDALIMLGQAVTEPPRPAVDGEVITVQRSVTLADGMGVTAVLNTAAEQEARYLPLFEQVVESLRLRP